MTSEIKQMLQQSTAMTDRHHDMQASYNNPFLTKLRSMVSLQNIAATEPGDSCEPSESSNHAGIDSEFIRATTISKDAELFDSEQLVPEKDSGTSSQKSCTHSHV